MMGAFIHNFEENVYNNCFAEIYCNITNEMMADYFDRTFKYLNIAKEYLKEIANG